MRTLVVETTTATRTAREAARTALRPQIARLERELSAAVVDGAPIPEHRGPGGGPRLLCLAALEAERDALSADLVATRAAVARTAAGQESARLRREAMLAAPAEHRFERVALAELGEGGCGVYAVRPRLGLIGMLAGWWHVKLSSGCPLATGIRVCVRSAGWPRSRRAARGPGGRGRRARGPRRPAGPPPHRRPRRCSRAAPAASHPRDSCRPRRRGSRRPGRPARRAGGPAGRAGSRPAAR